MNLKQIGYIGILLILLHVIFLASGKSINWDTYNPSTFTGVVCVVSGILVFCADIVILVFGGLTIYEGLDDN